MLTGMLLCLVVGISDGVTLTARCPTGDAAHPDRQVKVRLAEIDALESGQPFGRRSKEHLSALCSKTEVTTRQTATDRYGGMVARMVERRASRKGVVAIDQSYLMGTALYPCIARPDALGSHGQCCNNCS